MSRKRRKTWLTLGRVCPLCPGRLLALYDEGGDALYLECDDCGLVFSEPGATAASDSLLNDDRAGPVRPATVEDLIPAGWDVSKFSDAGSA